jgi:hypothetical protein
MILGRFAFGAMLESLLVAALAACGASSPDGGNGDTSARFAGSWTCSLVAEDQGGGTSDITDLQPSAFQTVVSGASLSIVAEESNSLQQSWFCGFHYVIDGLTASLVGTPVCTSDLMVTLQSAVISVSADGNELSLQESGMQHGFVVGITDAGMISGTCSRN